MKTTLAAVTRRSVLGFGFAAALVLPAAAETFVRVGGGLAGTYPVFAAKLVELINRDIDGVTANVVSGDIEKSLIGIQSGDLTITIAPSFNTKQVFDGLGTLGVPTPDVRHIITLYGSPIQPVAALDGPKSIAELAAGPNRVWMGQRAGFFYQIYVPIMEAAGISPDDIEAAGGVIEEYGYLDEVQGFQDRRLDAGIFAGPVPYGLLTQIEDSPGFRLIGMSEAELDKLEALRPGMGRITVPAGSYKNQDSAVMLPYYVNHLVASADADPELIYQITKLMYENYAEFHGLFAGSEEIDDVDVLKYNVLPVHPASERFYQEVGAM
ncbi:MAG: TAXI family TRAP transporter solute-binding subunit [Pseudomonadota bacterium]